MFNPLIRKLDAYFPLSDVDKTALAEATPYSQRIKARTDLVTEGDSPDHVHLIQSGFACRYKILPNGSRSIVAYLVPGDLCDLHGVILGWIDHSVGTLSACEVVSIPRGTLRDLTARSQNLANALWRTMLTDEAILRTWLVGIGRRSAAQHVAHILCELLVRLQVVGYADVDGYDLPLMQADISDAAGISNVHINRVLQALRRENLIVFKTRSLNIPDVEALKNFANFNPDYLHLNRKMSSTANLYEFAPLV